MTYNKAVTTVTHAFLQGFYCYICRYTTVTHQKEGDLMTKLTLNDQEQIFFDELMKQLKKFKGTIRPERMSNNALNVKYDGCQVGRIKLTGRKHWMQILKNMYDVDVIEGELDDFIQHIPEWVKYIKKYL